jgi:pyridoxal phosphate enzyme (YggS family)
MVKERLRECQENLKTAAMKAGRTLKEITLVAVTKGVSLPLIYEAINCGVEHIGESKMQEALTKYVVLNRYAQGMGRHLRWHMIGHLQTNKAREAVKIFDLIHSVDSVRLAEAINKEAGRMGKVQCVLLEVNVSYEDSKFGFRQEDVLEAAKKIVSLESLDIKGLMTIATVCQETEGCRSYFRRLKELKNDVQRLAGFPLSFLSMGMTDDYEVAVEEGANMVRIGRGLFGERQ